MKELCRYSNPLRSYWTINVTHFFLQKNVKLAEVATTVKSQLLQKQPACLMVIIANSL